MLFNSLEFVYFLLGVLVLYHSLERRAQNVLLLAASYYFYGSWNWRFLGLILLSTFVDYVCARIIDAEDSGPRRRKAALFASIVSNLGILATFKHFNFFIESLSELGLGFDPTSLRLDVVLPVGISFYTFQTMSYTIDVYRKDLEASRSLLDFSVYVAFFPQLVAGPIERASHFLPQVQKVRGVRYDLVCQGSWLILFGLFKKVVLADNMAPIADAAFTHADELSGLEVLTGVYAFALQIYGDFSGYSAIARGAALLMGFELLQNFRMPYFATSPSDFWRRWHISLSTWLRDYLYISLGGNRRGPTRTYVNLMLTMLLGGLWHGAAWHFVAWGAFHGALLILYASFPRDLLGSVLARVSSRVRSTAGGLVFFHLTCLGWVLFRADNMQMISDVLGSAGRFWPDPASVGAAQLGTLWVLISLSFGPVLLVEWAQEASKDMWVHRRWPAWVRLFLYALLFGLITSIGVTQGKEFIYFQF